MALTHDELLRRVVETYFRLRTAIYLIALALPTVIIAWTALDPDLSRQESLSGYYNTMARPVFVGSLAAVGVLLVVYRGYSTGENRLLNVAGVFAVGAAILPTARSGGCGDNRVCTAHQVSAAGFFVTIALAILLYSGTTLILTERRAWIFRLIYIVLSMALAGIVVLYVIYRDQYSLLYFETAGIYSFALYWLIKTYELSRSGFDQKMVARDI